MYQSLIFCIQGKVLHFSQVYCILLNGKRVVIKQFLELYAVALSTLGFFAGRGIF